MHCKEWSCARQKLYTTDTEVERAEAEPRRYYVLSADIEAHGHTGGCPGCAALASHGKSHIMTNAENESELSFKEL